MISRFTIRCVLLVSVLCVAAVFMSGCSACTMGQCDFTERVTDWLDRPDAVAASPSLTPTVEPVVAPQPTD